MENCPLLNQSLVPKRLGTAALGRCALKAHYAFLSYSALLRLFVSSEVTPGELNKPVPHSCADGGWQEAGISVEFLLTAQGIVTQNAFSDPTSPTNCYPPLVLMVSIPFYTIDLDIALFYFICCFLPQ